MLGFTVMLFFLVLAEAAPKRPTRVPIQSRGPLAWNNAQRVGDDGLHKLGYSRLLVHSVSDRTHKTYSPRLKAFLYDCKLRGQTLNSADDVDVALLSYLDDLCYVTNAGFSAASQTFAGLTNIAPELRDRLPRSARALLAWSRLSNPEEGGPVPEELIAMIIELFARRGLWWHALVTYTAYDSFLRESDWETITGSDIAVYDADMGKPPEVAFMLGNGARGLSTKGGSDQGVVVQHAFLAMIIKELKPMIPDASPLFPLDQLAYRRQWWNAMAMLNITQRWPPHSLRHSGPSHRVMRGESLESIRRRGRWVSLKSVARYTKHHVLVDRRAAVDKLIIMQGACMWPSLHRVLNMLATGSSPVEVAIQRAFPRTERHFLRHGTVQMP